MIEQWAIGILGTLAIYFSQQRNDNFKRYACLFGLAAQPFWYYTSYNAQQWGILTVSILYTLGWLIGLKNYWLSKIPSPD